MKTNKLVTLFAALLLATVCFGQTATTVTTLATAITDTTTATAVLTSATNVAANGTLYFTDGETMTVLGSYVSGTTVPVARGAQGTRAIKHAALVQVAVFAPGNQARVGLRSGILPGGEPRGACTAANEAVLPIYNSVLGTRYDCIGSVWVKTGGTPGTTSFCITTGATPTCTPVTGVGARTLAGSATLASNASVITFSPGFASATSYACVGNDVTTRANVVQVVTTSATSITITNTTGASDVISWSCSGY